jgi:APA family basic amino acid/polyamine antiporter
LHPGIIRRIVPAFGLAGCLIIAFSLPIGSVIAGVLVLGIGVLWWATRYWVRRPA